MSVDDKAIVPVGEPDCPVSTGVRGHSRSLVPLDERESELWNLSTCSVKVSLKYIEGEVLIQIWLKFMQK